MTASLTRLTWLAHGSIAQLAFIVLAAAAVFAFSLGLLALINAAAHPVRRRLGQMGLAGPARNQEALIGRLVSIGGRLLPRRKKERSRVSQLLMHAGLRSTNALPIFYAVKTLLIVGLPLAVFLASPLLPTLAPRRLLFYAAAAAVIGILAPSLWLDRRVLKRQRALRAGFPDALDLLVVCVEAGLGLAPALQRVADEITVSHPELGEELALVNAEMRAGVERTAALKNLAERSGLADIRGLVALLVQTMRFGTSIADALRVYSEEFRDKRKQAAEEQAAKIGTKMIFPLVFCLFPSFFLVAIGPAVLRLIAAFHFLLHR